MGYVTQTELAQLSCLPAEMLSTIDTLIVDANIDAASRLFDSYAAARFATPFVTVGLDAKSAVANVAGFWLAARFGYDPEDSADEAFRTRYRDAMRWFEAVQDGTAVPSGSSPVADTVSGAYSEEARGL